MHLWRSASATVFSFSQVLTEGYGGNPGAEGRHVPPPSGASGLVVIKAPEEQNVSRARRWYSFPTSCQGPTPLFLTQSQM